MGDASPNLPCCPLQPTPGSLPWGSAPPRHPGKATRGRGAWLEMVGGLLKAAIPAARGCSRSRPVGQECVCGGGPTGEPLGSGLCGCCWGGSAGDQLALLPTVLPPTLGSRGVYGGFDLKELTRPTLPLGSSSRYPLKSSHSHALWMVDLGGSGHAGTLISAPWESEPRNPPPALHHDPVSRAGMGLEPGLT